MPFSIDSFPGNYSTGEVGMFWDMSECVVPDELNDAEILERMRSSISDSGHRGHVSIYVYGDLTGHHFPSDAGVKLNHFPAGDKYAKETKMLEDVVAWSAENPEPSTLMLITGSISDELADVALLLKTRKNYHLICVEPSPTPTEVILIPTRSGGGN
uniref:NYN domain-containing protein n=4 Tax=Noccaea caerulescens TaxID=107243 RepID=A0A1J3K1R0_NOCCA